MAYKRISPSPVVEGGTGAQTLTGVLIGNGTSAVTGNAVTQYNTLVGGASNAISSIAPSATSGVPLVSGGSSANPSYGTAVVAGGGTGITSATAYAVLCGGTTSTGALQSIAGLGSSGQVLTSNGASALPTFQSAAAGSLILISTQTVSGVAAVTFTSGISSTYNNYLLLCTNVTNASSTPTMWIQISTNGGSSYIATGYLTNTNIATNGIAIGDVNSTAFFRSINTNIYNLTSGSGYVSTNSISVGGSSGAGTTQSYYSYYATASQTVNAIQLVLSSGTNFSGTFSLYGYAK
jgi:hypothetical protein